AGYEGYGYGYGYGQDNAGSYGYGLATSNSWDLSSSDVDLPPEGSGDAGMAKLGQRLDMVSHMDTDPMQGGHYGDRYDSFEPYDSRSSLPERDLLLAGSCREPEGLPSASSAAASTPPRALSCSSQLPQTLPQLSGHSPAPQCPSCAEWPKPDPSTPGVPSPVPQSGHCCHPHHGCSLRRSQPSTSTPKPMPLGGCWGGCRRPLLGVLLASPPSSLLLQPQRKKLKKDLGGKKQKQPGGCEDAREDNSDNSDSDNEEGTEGESGEKEEKEGSRGEGEDEEGRDSEKGALSVQEEISQLKHKLQGGKKTQDRQKKRHRDRMVERIQFVCSLCKYRTFYDDEMNAHLESKFHKEHFKFVGTKLPQQTAEFLQEYVANKTRKTEERRRGIEDITAVIQQIYRDQDLTQDVGMEHFIKKVEAAHCAACDLFIPMQFGIIQKHLKSLDHNHNRRAMMEQSKKSSLVVARSILNNKLISKKLERYLKGENPFTDDPEEKEEHEEGEGGAGGNAEEGAAEGGDENKEEEENVEGENLEEEENQGEENLEEKKEPEETPGAEEEREGTGTKPEGQAQVDAEADTEPAEGPQPGQEQQQAAEGVGGEEEEEASKEASAAQ
ncbi:AKP8L protein, partial [Indicator maculatus]|nr:AKP8L protein [Indicator maculatus]